MWLKSHGFDFKMKTTTTKRHKETFGGDGHVYDFDCDDGKWVHTKVQIY